MKRLCFLSGLPQSGLSLLSDVLNQNTNTYVALNSKLLNMFSSTFEGWNKKENAFGSETELRHILRSIAEATYSHTDKPIILDEDQGWAESTTMRVSAEIFGEKPKIVVTVRNIPDCAASLLQTASPEKATDFLRNSPEIKNLQKAYVDFNSGFQLGPECILFVEYENLLTDTQNELNRIHDFLGMPPYIYDLESIKTHVDIEQCNKPAEEVLGHMYDRFVQPRFWRGEEKVNRETHKLDLMLAQGLMGNFDEAKKLGEELAVLEPKDHRAAFNRGWYVLRDGHLLDGMKLIDRGRIEEVFGNGVPNVPTKKWSGETNATVLLNLEGGLGDQIHGVRFAKDISRLGNKVIVACSDSLAKIVGQVEGVTAVVHHEAAFGVVHDFWVPSMSAVIPLQLQYGDVDGAAYIPKPDVEKGKKFRIGLRWQGNPQFEHEQHRQFDPKLLFDAVEGVDAEFISLQRDEGSEHKPEWVKDTCLDSWLNTAAAIASCDLVITSCTSVAHLSGAMGIPTWVVIPILPYYLWAKPGDTTEWYDSVKLFRQPRYGYWTEPFNEVKQNLKEEIKNANSKNRLLGTSKRRESGSSMGLRPSFGA